MNAARERAYCILLNNIRRSDTLKRKQAENAIILARGMSDEALERMAAKPFRAEFGDSFASLWSIYCNEYNHYRQGSK